MLSTGSDWCQLNELAITGLLKGGGPHCEPRKQKSRAQRRGPQTNAICVIALAPVRRYVGNVGGCLHSSA
jgi:hypothetical protein